MYIYKLGYQCDWRHLAVPQSTASRDCSEMWSGDELSPELFLSSSTPYLECCLCNPSWCKPDVCDCDILCWLWLYRPSQWLRCDTFWEWQLPNFRSNGEGQRLVEFPLTMYRIGWGNNRRSSVCNRVRIGEVSGTGVLGMATGTSSCRLWSSVLSCHFDWSCSSRLET